MILFKRVYYSIKNSTLKVVSVLLLAVGIAEACVKERGVLVGENRASNFPNPKMI